MVETGHLPSKPAIETRSPCSSSSETLSTVPAFPSVRTTALPINSDRASPYSLKMFDARTITGGGIARPVRPSRLCCPEAAQRQGLSQRSAWGTIDGDCSSNSRSRSICVLRLPDSSGTSFRNARSLSPISRTIARLCAWSMSTRFRIATTRSSNRKRRDPAPTPPAALPLASTAGNSEWT